VAELLQAGEVVAAPSDTVYGFLALPSSGKARSALVRLKGRSENFLLLVGSWEDVRSWTQDVPEETMGRLRRVWPGPVTAVLPARTGRPAATRGTLGLRMPDSVFLRALLERVGEPLLSTSANRPGLPAPTRAEEVEVEFPEVPLVLDGGPSVSALPSTVVDLTVSPPRVLRRGRGDVEPLLDPPGPAS
jgi:L-threonylcarbamoyladenylate synthase